MFQYFDINEILISSYWGANILTILLFITALIVFAKPDKTLYKVLFTLVLISYTVLLNINISHSVHVFSGIILITFALWPSTNENFKITWEFLRYYICWLYFSAFLWKIIHLGFFQAEYGYEAFTDNLSWYIYQNPEDLLTKLYLYLVKHKLILNIGAKVIILLEGAFIIGFFTKKMDHYLVLSLLIIHISTFIFVDVMFFELFILVIPFITLNTWAKIDKLKDAIFYSFKKSKSIKI
ncbi:hypothetical protein [Pedobacter arcticus]|uniref:hypothetical protein n=1 Tax=Pedobacter arcticus TaxID=752140 RepID=UPI00037102DD|nr:hypothetical protein [Pedobacter arcticus]